jgi:hypothetical protein
VVEIEIERLGELKNPVTSLGAHVQPADKKRAIVSV